MRHFCKPRIFIGLFVVGVFLAGTISTAQADISYGSFEGDTVYFNNVLESTGSTGDPEGLFGGSLGPVVLGDQLLFFPTQFKSVSTNGAADTTSALLQFMLVAKPGNVIERIRIREIGDYTLSGGSASAKVNGLLTVTDLGGPNGIPFDSFNREYVWPIDSFGVFNESWEIALLYPTTMLQISLNNNLQTGSESGSTALIQKKVGDAAVALTVNPDPVPIPGALWLFSAGLGFGLWRFKKKA